MAAWVKRISLLLLFIVLLSSLAKFYGEKMQFVKNFRQHLTYTWNFERANLLTTIDPAPLAESLALIYRYSPPEQPGIYILSKYDNFLPFLAKKYSRMPFFEITWHLFSAKEVQEVLERIRQDRPQILFVDSKISDYTPDPWEKLFTGEWERRERASRLGRYGELEKIFKAVKEQYEVVAMGELISVYRRKE